MINERNIKGSDTFAISVIHFINFLNDNRVFAIVIASILSEQMNKLVISFIDGIIFPIVNRDIDGNGVEDVKQMEAKVIQIGGITFRVGIVIVNIIRFIIITLVVFALAHLSKKWFNNL